MTQITSEVEAGVGAHVGTKNVFIAETSVAHSTHVPPNVAPHEFVPMKDFVSPQSRLAGPANEIAAHERRRKIWTFIMAGGGANGMRLSESG